MLGEADGQLDLLARGDPALEGIGPLQDEGDLRMDRIADRPAEFARHDEVREVGRQPHFRHGVHQLQGIEQVRRDGVAMGFDGDWHSSRLAQPQPAVHIGGAGFDGEGIDLADDVQVTCSEIAGEADRRFEVRDGFWEGRHRRGETVAVEQRADAPGNGIARHDIDAVVAGRGDHLELLLQRPFEAVRPSPLHGPHGLKNLERLHSVTPP